MLIEKRYRLIKVIDAASRFEAAPNKLPDTVADETGNSVERKRFPPHIRKQSIGRRVQIWRTINQRAVEIKNDAAHGS